MYGDHPVPPPSGLPSDPAMKHDDGGNSDGDEQYHRDEKTPLIRHTSRKTEPPAARDYTAKLSTISDVKSDGIFTNDDDNDDDDDDRSISTYSLAGESIASLRSLTTLSLENFREGLAVPFTDVEGSCPKIVSGLGSLCIVGTVLGLVMPKNVYLQGQWFPWYRVVSSVIGYNYFVLWSVCFYPQVLLNYRRKSTQGLSNDFAILNLMGWTFYTSYLSSMYFDEDIKELYAERFSNDSSTVQSNDVAFSLHAMILSFIYLVQIVYYGDNTCSFHLKPFTWLLVLSMGIPSAVVPILINVGYLPYSAWLDYFYVLSFFKICCTLTKYTKQVTLNWKRQSTSGWNIWYNFLECSGGSLSMLQVVLDSIDMQDFTGITGNMAKFVLGFATIFFDGIFFVQHYILYPSSNKDTEHEDKNDGIPRQIKTPTLERAMVKTSSRLNLSHDGVANADMEI